MSNEGTYELCGFSFLKSPLTISCADHETGALALRDGNIKEGKMKAMFVSKGHTPIMVPLFAYGPQSKLFGGVQENSDVSNKILQLLAK